MEEMIAQNIVTIDWVLLIGISCGVVGVIEWIKNLFKSFKVDVPSWIWSAILPFVCVGVAIGADGGLYQVITNAIMLLAICQIGYDYILGTIRKKLLPQGTV